MLVRAARSVPVRPLTRSLVHYSRYRPISIPEMPLTQYILEDADKFGEKPALVDGPSGRTIKYNELATRFGTAAKGLMDRGFKKGDVLGIHMPNSPEYAVAFHAAAVAGGTNTTSNPMYTAEELGHQLKAAKAKFLLTIPPFLETAKKAAEHAGVKEVFVLGDPKCFLHDQGRFDAREVQVKVNPKEDLVVLPFSSGTTGLPKGTMLTHQNLLSNIAQLSAHPEMKIDLHADDTMIGVLPFMHIYGMVVVMNLPLRVGATVVTVPKFDPEDFLKVLAKHQVTWAPIVPPIVLFLAKHPLVSKFDLSKLRLIFSGAAPLDKELQAAVMKRLGVEACQGYGLTELSPVSHFSVKNHVRPGSVGFLVPNCTAKILGPDGEPVWYGEGNVGEICVKGPNVMKGYLDNPEATKVTIDSEGYLHTGDLGYATHDGYFYVVDRMKELIKVKGFQVAPAELEGILLEHPEIADAAVIPVPDEREGERPKAFVVRANTPAGQALTEDQVKHFLDGRVATYKQLKEVEFIAQVPKSPAGKILRRVLRDLERHKIQKGDLKP